MAISPSSGSITSPPPEISNELSTSATTSIASSRRKTRSVRQSLAISTAERLGGRAGKTGKHVIVMQAADLPRGVLDDRLAHTHLTVTRDYHLPGLANADDSGRADLGVEIRLVGGHGDKPL